MRDDKERDWDGESDARTLAEAGAIMEDPGRAMRAKRAAKQLAKEENLRAAMMNVVAGKTLSKNKKQGGFLGALPSSPYYNGGD